MREIIIDDLREKEKNGKVTIPQKFSSVTGNIRNGLFEAVAKTDKEIHFLYMPVSQNHTREEAKKEGEAVKNEEQSPTPIFKRECINLKEDEFITFFGKKMKVGKFYFCKALYQGEIIDWGVDVEKVINMSTYQIIFDKDGMRGYNIF